MHGTIRKKDGNFPRRNLKSRLNPNINFFADGLLCFNIWEGQLGDYQEMMRQLEKDGKWICLSRETLPLFTAVDMPKECLGFVYKILKN